MKVYGRGENLTVRHPKTPSPMVTKICVGDYVGDIYHNAKFYPNRFRGFFSPYTRNIHPHVRYATLYACLLLFFGSSNRLQPRRLHGF